ncbi:MAG: hypothetical protein DWI47_02800 [Chloroflexi bacterium]|nr:MAG: hypothetical protein DWI47_02800 [Chloroflexota bacterium]
MSYMLDEPKESPRGIAQIAAAISNALLGIAMIAASLRGLFEIAVVAFDIADQTWVSLGTQITAELGTQIATELGGDVATLFESFQIDITVALTTLLATLADQNNLPEFGAWVRQILALLMVAAVALGVAGAAPLWVALALWSRRSSGAVLLFGALLSAIGAFGLVVTGAPQVIWGLVLANGVLTLVASRTIRPPVLRAESAQA